MFAISTVLLAILVLMALVLLPPLLILGPVILGRLARRRLFSFRPQP